VADRTTEQLNPRARGIEDMPANRAVALFLAEDASISVAVAAAAGPIALAVDTIVERMARDGRLFYVGAGTSGRLGALDAAECPPTFGTDPDRVQAIIAGGEAALTRAVESAEDDPEAAGAELDLRRLGPDDVVVGITAGGTTPFVHGAIDHARAAGAATVFLSCVPADQVPDRADVSIRVVTGPEVVAGSTRLKAGTATKMVLNMLSTLSMARLGHVKDGRMLDLNAAGSAKLEERGVAILAGMTDLPTEEARILLRQSGGQVREAVQRHGADRG